MITHKHTYRLPFYTKEPHLVGTGALVCSKCGATKENKPVALTRINSKAPKALSSIDNHAPMLLSKLDRPKKRRC